MAIDSIGNGDLPHSSRVDEHRRSQQNGTSLARGNGNATRNSTASSDTVSITSTAETLFTAEKTIQSHPVVDKNRVEQIRQQIANGQYQVNPERVAVKMMALESLLDAKLGK